MENLKTTFDLKNAIDAVTPTIQVRSKTYARVLPISQELAVNEELQKRKRIFSLLYGLKLAVGQFLCIYTLSKTGFFYNLSFIFEF